jgi:hypothetical protein
MNKYKKLIYKLRIELNKLNNQDKMQVRMQNNFMVKQLNFSNNMKIFYHKLYQVFG